VSHARSGELRLRTIRRLTAVPNINRDGGFLSADFAAPLVLCDSLKLA